MATTPALAEFSWVLQAFLGGNSALPILGPQKHHFLSHFRASKPVLAKARLLKHDFPVHGFSPQFEGFTA